MVRLSKSRRSAEANEYANLHYVRSHLICTVLQGCADSGNGKSVGSASGGKSVSELRKELTETARQLEGPFAVVVEDIAENVERGHQPFSIADGRINESGPGQHKFAEETITAYKKWRAAKLAEDLKK